jgi:secretion/DNA translocation related TadE-like protein
VTVGPGRGQRGSVSVVTVALLGIVVLLAMGVADVSSVVLASARAQDAADSAALAAAQEMATGSGLPPADLAAEYAGRNGASVVSCACEAGSLEAVVTVGVSSGPLLLFPDDRTVQASARAVVNLP